ncbi:MAG: DUF523 domain-containing protein [Coriobacteriia bacterium]|nr:DUF523 domain-containing protein [Coriobacteriia bacterium]
MIMISACLLGKKCRYNGEHNLNEGLVQQLQNEKLEYINLCPELLGGMSVPRIPCEIVGGTGKEVLAGTAKVMNADGEDVTEAFMKGAAEVLRRCREKQVTKAYLKSKSPSCGYGKTYDGSFEGTVHLGNGVLAELLSQKGIEVIAVG